MFELFDTNSTFWQIHFMIWKNQNILQITCKCLKIFESIFLVDMQFCVDCFNGIKNVFPDT